MLAKNHVPVAIAAWAISAPILGVSIPFMLATVPLAALAGTLPDVDHPGSWIGRKLPGVSHLIRLVLGHRGGTHSLLAVALCAWGLYYLRSSVASIGSLSATAFAAGLASILVGYVSHILADGLTKRGVPLLWPIRKSFRTPLAFTTGGSIETLVTYGIVAFTGWYYMPLITQ